MAEEKQGVGEKESYRQALSACKRIVFGMGDFD